MTAQFTAFEGPRRLATGALADVALAVKRAEQSGADEPILIFSNATGRAIDLDLRGRGRPRLGVVAREVTLLPRHWEWLNAQPGGASVALRKLVEQARRSNGDAERQRAARDAAYHFMSAMAGNLPGFEEASRAMFAGDQSKFTRLIATWPADISDHVVKLAYADRAE
jgi:uncharacterized protein